MNFIVDNQLPVALARYLSAAGLSCIHVQDVKLDAAEDSDIWLYAKQRGGIVVTKDEDFHALSIRQASIPPQVVWVRIGNCRKTVLLNVFSKLLPTLLTALQGGEAIVEIR